MDDIDIVADDSFEAAELRSVSFHDIFVILLDHTISFLWLNALILFSPQILLFELIEIRSESECGGVVSDVQDVGDAQWCYAPREVQYMSPILAAILIFFVTSHGKWMGHFNIFRVSPDKMPYWLIQQGIRCSINVRFGSGINTTNQGRSYIISVLPRDCTSGWEVILSDYFFDPASVFKLCGDLWLLYILIWSLS